MTTRGVVYIAMGAPARAEAAASIDSYLDRSTGAARFGVHVISETAKPLNSEWHIRPTPVPDDPTDPGARRIKTSLPDYSPYNHTLYLDADTRILGDITPLFDLIDRWPIIITASTRQGDDTLGNCPPEDRLATFNTYNTRHLVGLQCGMIGFQRDNPRVQALFRAWREEWEHFRDRDQAAFLRALYRVPVPIWIVGRDFNGGALVQHRYGAADRTRRPRH